MVYKKNAKIVVIDDEADICDLLKLVLEEEEFHVTIYSDSKKFSDDFVNYTSDNLDLVIVDLMMPKMDGFQIMELLNSKESTRYIPKIVISAYQSKDNLKEAYNYGAIQFVEKPIAIEHFIYQVKTLLRIKLYEDNNRCIIDLLQEKNKKMTEEIAKLNKSEGNRELEGIESNLEGVSKLIKVNYEIIENFFVMLKERYPDLTKSKENEVMSEIEKNMKLLFDKRVDLDALSNFMKKNFNCFE